MEKLKVSVQTLPNGYSLEINNKEKFMYHSIDGLLEGIMYHVGLEELGCVDTASIKDFLTAAVVWRADKKGISKQIKRLTEENERLTSICENLRTQLRRARNALNELTNKQDDENGEQDDE